MEVHVIGPGEAAFDENTAVVVPVFEDGERAYGSVALEGNRAALKRLTERGRIPGKADTHYFLSTPDSDHAAVAALGLGPRADFDAEVLRRSAGALGATLARERIGRIVLDGTVGDAIPVEAFIEGIMLGQYRFGAFKKTETPPPVSVEELVVVEPVADELEDVRLGCGHAVLVCQNTNWARDLGNTPAADLTPSLLAAAAERMAKELDCGCTIFDEDALEDHGMTGILSVGKGSAEPPRLIVLEYRPEDAQQTFALVGKGVTFDTGGISLKPSLDLHEMKFDMCGAAGVLGAFRTIVQMKAHVNLVCAVPSAENRPGPDAYLPGDILRMMTGKTVEVVNTDAEGRLLLADALAYVEKTFAPDAMVNLATLTGAMVVALGHYAAGVFGNHDGLTADLDEAGHASGDRVWPMPLWDEYAKLIEGTHGDIVNAGPRGEAGSITAAQFLNAFVEKTPWAHVDIAGTAWGGKHIPYLNKDDATGFGVRLLTQWVKEAVNRE